MSTDTTPGLGAERSAFEAVFAAPPFEFDMTRHPENSAWPGNYRSYQVQCAWDAWQEGRRAPAPAPQGPAARHMTAVAWLHEEDPRRVISDAQREAARRDSGASWTSVEAYTVPLVRKP